MKFSFSRPCLLMLLVILTAIDSGCARYRRGKCEPGCSKTNLSSPRPKNELIFIPFESRHWSIQADQLDPVQGLPLNAFPKQSDSLSHPVQLRQLKLEELRSIASCEAPIANRIESHRDWLQSLNRTPRAILNALSFQARFERSRHRINSEEAYFNLARVYTKLSILQRSQDMLVTSQNAMDKFREAGVELTFEPYELSRQKMKLAEQMIEAYSAQLGLNDALDSLLNLASASDSPIWTHFETHDVPALPTESAAIEQALANRGDLKGLEELASNSSSLSIESIRGLDSSSQMFGLGFELPGKGRWWQCLLKDEIECLKQSSQAELKKQLQAMVANKQEQIRLEVRQSLQTLKRLNELLERKTERLVSLRNSMESADKVKDVRPVDFKERLEQRVDELTLIAEIAEKRIEIEFEQSRLQFLTGNVNDYLLPGPASPAFEN